MGRVGSSLDQWRSQTRQNEQNESLAKMVFCWQEHERLHLLLEANTPVNGEHNPSQMLARPRQRLESGSSYKDSVPLLTVLH